MLVALAGRHHVLPCASRLRNKWRPFAPPRVVRTCGPARDHHYYEHLRLLAWAERPSPWEELRRRLSLAYSPCQISPLTHASLPRMSPTSTPPVHWPAPRRLVWSRTLRPSLCTQKLGCRLCTFEAHGCGSCLLRPAGSIPSLLPTPPRGGAVTIGYGVPEHPGGDFHPADSMRSQAHPLAAAPPGRASRPGHPQSPSYKLEAQASE